MSAYRHGAILGLTVAETFILLTFLLLLALLGLVPQDESFAESDSGLSPRIWVRPERIETLVNEADDARKAEERAKRAQAVAERERDDARRKLELLRQKGENPPCWYQHVTTSHGKTREKPYYVFNVAIYEDSIQLAPRTPPPGGAFDDGGGLYVDEWNRLGIEKLPFGTRLSDDEFAGAVRDLVAQGRNRQVRTYECVFSVMVWDKTPDHAKNRWKYAHDRIIEGSFSAYTVQELEWKDLD